MKKLFDFLVKYLTPKSLSIILTIGYLASLVPLLMIARYNYPSADDYSIGETCRHAWTATHSVGQVIYQAMQMAVHDYFEWMGYFASIFFMSFHPGVFGEKWYSLTTWIMVGSLSGATAYLLHAVMVKALKMDKNICRSVTMITLFVTVQCMVGRVEAFYWFCGAVNYIFLHAASFFMYGALISAVYDRKRSKRIWDLVIASVMGICTGAGNYMTALNVCIVLVTGFGLMLYRRKLKRHKALLIPAGLYLAAFLASVLAPGNHVRAEGATGMNPVKAVLISFYYALDYALSQWTTWVVLLLIITLIPLFWKAAGQTTFSYPCPLLAAIFSYCLLSAMITPPLFAVSNIMAGRLQALIYIMYILLLVFNTGYITGWVRKRIEGTALSNIDLKQNNEPPGKFTANTAVALLACGIFLVFGGVLCTVPEPHYFTFTSAVTDLSNGSARQYGTALAERAKLLNDPNSEKNLIFEPLPSQPALLYFSDITADPNDWTNRAVARYYNKGSVIINN